MFTIYLVGSYWDFRGGGGSIHSVLQYLGGGGFKYFWVYEGEGIKKLPKILVLDTKLWKTYVSRLVNKKISNIKTMLN